jgi:hypothetical protein
MKQFRPPTQLDLILKTLSASQIESEKFDRMTCDNCGRIYLYEKQGNLGQMPDGVLFGAAGNWWCNDCSTCKECNCFCIPDECGCAIGCSHS